MKTIEVTVKTVYGNEMIYPENKAAHAFAAIAGTKTLSRRVLKIAQTHLDYAIVEVHERSGIKASFAA
jgi:hypothetical protein